ncbi:MAG: tetratricopeptide repeat protein [Terriglobia bacterium]
MFPIIRRKAIGLDLCLAFSMILFAANLVAADALPRPAQEEDVFSRGVQAYSSGDYASAEKLLSSYLNNNPKSMIRDIGLLWYGRTLIALNRLDDARKVVESMDKEFPKSPLTRKLHEELDNYAKGRKSPPPQKAAVAKAAKETVKSSETKPQPPKQEAAVKAAPMKPVTAGAKGQATAAKKEAPKQPAMAENQKKPAAPAVAKTEKPSLAAPVKVSPVPAKPQEAKHPVAVSQVKEKQPVKKAEAAATTPVAAKPPAPIVKKQEKPKAMEMAQAQKPVAPGSMQKAKEAKVPPSKEAPKPKESVIQKPAGKPAGVTAASTSTPKPVKPSQATRKGKAAEVKEAKKGATEKAKPKAEEPEEKSVVFLNRRDPFRPLVVRASDEPPTNLPPGKKGLQVGRLQLKGIVKTGDGYYAVVQSSSNPAAIFLREKDVLHDGEVQKIYDDRIIFRHFATDPLGKQYEEEITRRLPAGGAL